MLKQQIMKAVQNFGAEPLAFIPVKGDRAQAPGAYVLWRRGKEHGTHFYNGQDTGLHLGHYGFENLLAGMANVIERAARNGASLDVFATISDWRS